ncbi:MAG: hypothetical protein HWE16_08780 [Gammaproteobacteria bacterium]|nr:hypothetical protein [Gammaproteobacteria bacterium]
MKKALFLLMIFFSSVAALASNGLAAAEQREPKRDRDVECRIISKSSAMRAVAGRTDGKVISAYLTRGRPPMYRVKTLSKSGRVKSVSVNACNGQVYG